MWKRDVSPLSNRHAPSADEAIGGAGVKNPFGFEECRAVAEWLAERTSIRPRVGLICGSGLGGLAEILQDKMSFDYSDIPNFPTSTVAGHESRLVFGRLGGQEVVCMQGRFHAYEGYPLMQCAFPVRVMRFLGATVMIITNSAGGLNVDYKAGDIMVLKDQINLPGFSGDNPLRGPNDERFGPRFLAMNRAYDRSLRDLLLASAEELNLTFVRVGTYVKIGGPCYETPSEARALRMLGADAVGMSVAHEVIIAVHCGMRVVGMSLIANLVVDDVDEVVETNHEEVLETAKNRANIMEQLMTLFISKLSENNLEPAQFRPAIDGFCESMRSRRTI